jgi:hypothetical protein
MLNISLNNLIMESHEIAHIDSSAVFLFCCLKEFQLRVFSMFFWKKNEGNSFYWPLNSFYLRFFISFICFVVFSKSICNTNLPFELNMLATSTFLAGPPEACCYIFHVIMKYTFLHIFFLFKNPTTTFFFFKVHIFILIYLFFIICSCTVFRMSIFYLLFI